jgi:hypothetical protein
VAKLVHLIYHKTNVDLYFEILMKFKRVFVKGGVKRMKYTLPAMIFSLFRLSNEVVIRPPSDGTEPQASEETKEAPHEEDELPMKLVKVD